MSPNDEWKQEIRAGLRRENWSLVGPNRVVKVVSRQSATALTAGGYITVGSALVGKTPGQLERMLGLPSNYLAQGARIYRFSRLPRLAEYEYDLTTHFPGGLAYNPAHSDPRYLPGTPRAHQWKIRDGVQIPVDTKNFLDLAPGDKVPYHWLLT